MKKILPVILLALILLVSTAVAEEPAESKDSCLRLCCTGKHLLSGLRRRPG